MSQSNHPPSPIPASASAQIPTPARAPRQTLGPTQAPANPNIATPQPPPSAAPAPVQPATSVASGIPPGGSATSPRPSAPNPNHGSTPPSAAATSVASQTPQTVTPASSAGSPGPSPAVIAGQAPGGSQTVGRKSTLSKLWALKTLFCALVVIAITDALTLTADSPSSPLGSIGYSNGVLVLSILSVLTGYALVAAAKTAWDRGRFLLLQRKGDHGQNLLVFWTLSAGIGGSCLILWKEFFKPFGAGTRQNNGNSNRPASSAQRGSRGHPKLWSIWRIISWIATQFPGIIIMTIVNSTTSYVPTQWIKVSGGIGIYDPRLAVPGGADQILMTDLTLNILQDTRSAIQVSPTNADCIKAQDSCNAYLLPGGLGAISPWPNRIINDTSLDIYVTKGEPVYQLDFWGVPSNYTFSPDSCNVYAVDSNTGFQLCASPYAGQSGQIIAGWTPCTDTILPSGECNNTGSWGAYIHFSTILSISRRTASVKTRRDTGAILAWSDLGPAETQNITASDFKPAFDAMFQPFLNSSSSILNIDYIWLLTAKIAIALNFDLDAGNSSEPYDLLRNSFATALFMYNPMSYLVGPHITDIQPDLPAENYFNGSNARTRIHAVPQRWTVLTYVAASGFLLLATFIAIAATARYEGPEASEFPFVDLLHLRLEGETGETDIRSLFHNIDYTKDEKILEQAESAKVKLRRRTVTGNGNNP